MILKSYETKKININLNKIVLFYGQNEGFKEGRLGRQSKGCGNWREGW